MKHYLSLLLIGLLASCERDYLLPEYNQDGYNPSQTIVIAPILETNDDGVVTRGTPIVNSSQMTDMGVFCSATGSVDWTSSAVLGKMFNTSLRLNKLTGRWEYSSSIVNWDAANSNSRYTFFAYAPYASPSNGIAVQGSETTTGVPSLIYTTPTNCTSQPDLMLAVPRYNLRPATSMVSLQMKHALTCVGFQVQGNGDKIKSLTISGIFSRGRIKLDGGAIAWTTLDQPSNFSPVLNYDAGKNYYTATTTMSTNLLPGDGYMMMIPQTLSAGTLLTITFDDGSTRSLTLSGSWVAGKRITYNIIITELGIIAITPSTMLIPSLGVSALTDNLTLSCTPVDLKWNIKTDSGWLRLTTNSSGTGASQTLSGQGAATIYTIADANTTSSDRVAIVSIRGQTPIVVLSTITQLKDINPSTVGRGTPPIGVKTYVGAFWRTSQVGERIIRIPVGSDAQNVGTWSASVIWQDSNWALGDILFSTSATTDSGVSFTLPTATPGDAESFMVTDNNTVASGSVAANGTIYFRIGLRRIFTASENIPARYAVVALSYNNRTKNQLIFIRQGGGADYLMRPIDAAVGSYTNSSRPLARKFMCFNLTSPYTSTWVGGSNILQHSQLSIEGAAITSFPTQAGAMFQWAIMDLPRYAIHPINPETGLFTGLSVLTSATYWTEGADTGILSVTQDVCPKGYRRVNDGAESTASDGKASKSELRQSLLATLTDGSSTPNSTAVVGYYADGFFDRRCIISSTSAYPNTAVSYVGGSQGLVNSSVAYIGTLLFNPNNWASLFFPSAGFRMGGSLPPGVPVVLAGESGAYWTSSSLSNRANAVYASLGGTGVRVAFGDDNARSSAMSIRCVKTP